MPIFHFTVDGEPFQTEEHVLTPRRILEMAGRDPATTYLIEIEGSHQKSYKDNMDAQIHMHEHQKFISAYLGPVPVSAC